MAETTASTTAAKPKKSTASKAASSRSKPAIPLAAESGTDTAKARFANAIEEAKAGVQALGKEAQGKAGAYREKATAAGGEWREKATAASAEWIDEAKVRGTQAKDKATELAVEGKTRASEAISGVAKLVEENAPTIDAKLGTKYGDYARKASTSLQSAATRLDEKDIAELGDDAREFVRKSPGLAIGLAAVAGYMVARLFRSSAD